MIILLGILHFCLLSFTSYYFAGYYLKSRIDRIILSYLFVWANLIATAQLISIFGMLNSIAFYLSVSSIIVVILYLFVKKTKKLKPYNTIERHRYYSKKSKISIILFASLIGLLLVINLITIINYTPNNYDSETYHLPRIFFYFSQGDLSHFTTPNERQVFFPFNSTLVQLFIVQYGFHVCCFGIINLMAWFVIGLLIYKICLSINVSFLYSLITAFIALTATNVLSQASTTNNDILLGAFIAGCLYYYILWLKTDASLYFIFMVISLSIAIGIKVTIAYFIPGFLIFMIIQLIQQPYKKYFKKKYIRLYMISLILFLFFAAPSYIINIVETGKISAPGQKKYINLPFNLQTSLQNVSGTIIQSATNPLAIVSSAIIPQYNNYFPYLPKQIFAYQCNKYIQKNLINPYWNLNLSSVNSQWTLNPVSTNIVEDEVWFGALFYLFPFCLYHLLNKKIKIPKEIQICVFGIFSFFISYCLLMKWQPWAGRFFCGVSLLMAVICGYTFESLSQSKLLNLPKRIVIGFTIIFIIFESAVYVFHNERRPLGNKKQKVENKNANIFNEIKNIEQDSIAIVRFDCHGSDQKLLFLMKGNNRKRFFQTNNLQSNMYNFISTTDSNITKLTNKANHNPTDFRYIGKTSTYWFEVTEHK